MYVCICHGVTDRAIREARARGVATIDELGAETGCGSACGACRPMVAELLGTDCCGMDRHGTHHALALHAIA
jgi:bacterioferritin-associated ferredoxin